MSSNAALPDGQRSPAFINDRVNGGGPESFGLPGFLPKAEARQMDYYCDPVAAGAGSIRKIPPGLASTTR